MSARDLLRLAENNALRAQLAVAGGGTIDANTNSSSGFYVGSGRSTTPKERSRFSIKGKKGRAAIITIIALIFGGGAFLATSNSLLPAAIEALFTEKTDTQNTSYMLRLPKIQKYMMGATKATSNGAKIYTRMPGSFKSRLAKYNITVDGSGSSTRLLWKDSNGIVSSISADDFDNMFMHNVAFRDDYMKAKRGRVANFFDDIANRIYSKLGLSRNWFNTYRQSGNTDTDIANYNKTLKPKFDTDSAKVHGGGNAWVDVVTGQDENGDDIIEKVVEPITSGTDKANTNKQTAGQAFLNSASHMSELLTSTVCAIKQVGSMLSSTLSALESYASINYFMGIMENISKMKAGYGDASAINTVLNFFSTKATASVPTIANGAEGTFTTTGSPLESNGMRNILGNAPINLSETKHYSTSRASNAVESVLGKYNSNTATACAGTSLALSTAALAVSFTGVGALAVTFAHFTKLIAATAEQIAINAAVTAALGFLIPTIANVLFDNYFEKAFGIPGGEYFTLGASRANTFIGRSGSGQSLSSESAVTAYNKATNTVLAMEAEIDRKNHSPFDITNKNTFFGSIAYSLLPTLTSTSITSISSLIRSTSSSLSSLLGSVSADGKGSTYMTTFNKCEDLESIHAVGDAYCTPITTTDLTTNDIEPDDATYQKILRENGLVCNGNGDCKITPSSNLAYYVSFCNNRYSPFGIFDAGILSVFGASAAVTNTIPTVPDTVTRTILGIFNITVPGIIDIIDNLAALDPRNQMWASGAMCVNSTENPYWNNEIKYYQRYVEDMRIIEQIYDNDGTSTEDSFTNPVTAYQEEYEKEHPLDNTPSGYIARITGMSKSDAETTLAFVDYYQRLNEYDPENRIAMNDATTIKSDSEIILAANTDRANSELSIETTPEIYPTTHLLVAQQHIIYADVRNRSYAV